MDAQQAVEFMRTTGRNVRYAGDTQWAALSHDGKTVYGGCFSEDCEGCDARDSVEDWLYCNKDEKFEEGRT